MKLYTEIYLLLVASTVAIDFMLYKQSKKKTFFTKILIFSSTILFLTGFTWVKVAYKYYTAPELPLYIMWFDFVFLVIYLPKLIRIITNFISLKSSISPTTLNAISFGTIILAIGILAAGAFIYPNKIAVTTTGIPFKNLPQSFNDYCIVQFSDVHLGSRPNDRAFYTKMVSVINLQNPDIVVFTGDMVNNFASEMNGFDSLFLKIKSKDGNFAILGNHDYGDYTVWDSPLQKAKNLEQVKNTFNRFGFRLLTNESVVLQRQNSSIELIGVENYSKKANKNYADLKKAMKHTHSDSFKILLSHNPEHWEQEILPQTNIDLTLSGHTHAAQFGLKLFGKVYSPAAFMFHQFNGLYESEKQKIYVSHGIGYIGLPIIMGLYPEISVIKLKKMN